MLAARQPKGRSFSFGERGRRVLKEMVAAQDIHDYLAELRREARAQCILPDQGTAELVRLFDSLAVLHAFRPGQDGWPHEHMVAVIRSLPDGEKERACLAGEILPCQAFGFDLNSDPHEPEPEPQQSYGLASTHWPSAKDQTSDAKTWWEMLPDRIVAGRDPSSHHIDVLSFEGPHAGHLLQQHEGTYLFTDSEGRLKPVQVLLLPAASESVYGEVLAEYLGWNGDPQEMSRQEAGHERYGWQPVAAVYAWQKTVSRDGCYRRMIDFRRSLTATTSEGIDPIDAFRAALPLPPELEE